MYVCICMYTCMCTCIPVPVKNLFGDICNHLNFIQCTIYTIGEKLEMGKCWGSPFELKQGTILIRLKLPKH